MGRSLATDVEVELAGAAGDVVQDASQTVDDEVQAPKGENLNRHSCWVKPELSLRSGDEAQIMVEANQQWKHGQGNGSGRQAPAKKTWKKYLTFLSMFHNKMKHRKPDTKAPNGFKQRRNPKRSSTTVLQECSNLVRVIGQTAADCFAAATASGAGDEDELPCYMQLDQVSYGVKREAFGPIYLVT
ncbi:hypothetical protein BAE44_0018046 [Dichanthelium oligosanthes]|uniref:Uncharacterized protein n=1 Tax=Dichanthelium oligosanthes TaxID=888268 RepID=A0A1E5V7H3_9POAL|nr:hypothetical protein BAE44_0018046 [Dichanthelium oligosanthes]